MRTHLAIFLYENYLQLNTFKRFYSSEPLVLMGWRVVFCIQNSNDNRLTSHLFLMQSLSRYPAGHLHYPTQAFFRELLKSE